MKTTEIRQDRRLSAQQDGVSIIWLFLALSVIFFLLILLVLGFGFGGGLSLFSPPHFKERPAACASNLKNIGTALDFYQVDTGSYPPGLDKLLPGYMRSLPSCPSARRDTYSRSYQHSYGTRPEEQNYTIFCEGSYHLTYTRQPNLPLYSRRNGIVAAPAGGTGNVCGENLAKIREALGRYAADHGGRYPEKLQGLVPGYLPSIPVCLKAGAHGMDSYSGNYRCLNDEAGGSKSSYTLYCSSCSGG